MKDLENKLMRILKESNLISLFDYNYTKSEETNIEGEFSYKYFVDMRNSIKNPLHISSFEFYTRKYSYKDGSFSKFRIYHDSKMPRIVHNELEELNYVISRSKSYIDFASDNIDNLISVGKKVYDIIS
ncbi:MAG: hypothetical protein ACRCX2_22095 [Paraclostridium sp.]